MTDLDKLARELLAAEYDRTATVGHAQMLRSTMPITTSVDKRAVNAIRAALLTAPPGYVLVPVEPHHRRAYRPAGEARPGREGQVRRDP